MKDERWNIFKKLKHVWLPTIQHLKLNYYRRVCPGLLVFYVEAPQNRCSVQPKPLHSQRHPTASPSLWKSQHMAVSLAKPKGLQPPYRSVLGAHMDHCTMKKEAAVYSPKTSGSFKSSHGRFSFQYPSSPPCGTHLGLKLPLLHSNRQRERGCVYLCVWEKGTFFVNERGCGLNLYMGVCAWTDSPAQNSHLPLTPARSAPALERQQWRRRRKWAGEGKKRAERK